MLEQKRKRSLCEKQDLLNELLRKEEEDVNLKIVFIIFFSYFLF